MNCLFSYLSYLQGNEIVAIILLVPAKIIIGRSSVSQPSKTLYLSDRNCVKSYTF